MALAPSITPMDVKTLFMIKRSSPSVLTSVPGPFAKQHPVARFDVNRNAMRACRFRHGHPVTTAMTSPSCGFSLTVSGIMMPPPCLFLSFDAADDDTIVQWTEFYMGFAPGLTCGCRPHAKIARRSSSDPKPKCR